MKGRDEVGSPIPKDMVDMLELLDLLEQIFSNS